MQRFAILFHEGVDNKNKNNYRLRHINGNEGVSPMQNLEKAAGGKSVQSNDQVLAKLNELYLEAFGHDGFAELRVEIRILRRGQKEVILHCGKQYRFVVDCLSSAA
ncbi:MAG: hypothetical protein LBI92_03365 [Azoarcus sp.]|nr:hypothetical protein [Azoarcus sp.]